MFRFSFFQFTMLRNKLNLLQIELKGKKQNITIRCQKCNYSTVSLKTIFMGKEYQEKQ